MKPESGYVTLTAMRLDIGAKDQWIVRENGTVIDGIYTLQQVYDLPKSGPDSFLEVRLVERDGSIESNWIRLHDDTKISGLIRVLMRTLKARFSSWN